jgi:CelD/BcsL family acetyltransferase involved in cellulose biosynthesis
MGASVIALPETIALPALGARDAVALRLDVEVRRDRSALDDQRAQRFHRRVLPLLLAAGTLRMVRLTCDGRTIAVFYGLLNGRCWGSYQIGYDRQWAGRIHLGKVTFSTAISLAAAEGATEFDFLKGAEGVKYLWPVNEHVTIDAEVYSGRSGAQLTRARRASRELASAVVKSMRDWFPMGRRG